MSISQVKSRTLRTKGSNLRFSRLHQLTDKLDNEAPRIFNLLPQSKTAAKYSQKGFVPIICHTKPENFDLIRPFQQILPHKTEENRPSRSVRMLILLGLVEDFSKEMRFQQLPAKDPFTTTKGSLFGVGISTVCTLSGLNLINGIRMVVGMDCDNQ